MADRTIYLTGGISVTSSRLLVKNALEVFGPIELCNMGLRAKLNDMSQAPPVVRFKTVDGAQKAMMAIRAGQVVVVGLVVIAEWKKESDGGGRGNMIRTDRNISARDLLNAPVSRGYDRSRTRSRGRGRYDDNPRGGRGGDRRGGRQDSRDRYQGRGPPPRRRDPSPLALENHAFQGRARSPQGRAAPAQRYNLDPPPVPELPPKPKEKGSFTACGEGHKLTDFTIESYGIEYGCDICNVGYRNVGTHMMCCKPCDYFVCETCTDSYHGVLG